MAIEVRVPTILRTYTDGEKAVAGEGSSLAELIDDLESRHPGIKDRLVDGADAARFLTTVKERLEEGAFDSDLNL